MARKSYTTARPQVVQFLNNQRKRRGSPVEAIVAVIEGLQPVGDYLGAAAVGDASSITLTSEGTLTNFGWRIRDGASLGAGASPTSYDAADTGNPISPAYLEAFGEIDGIPFVRSAAIRASKIAYSVQPSFDATPKIGETIPFDEGTAVGATIEVVELTLASVDKSGELAGLDWDTTGESAGEIRWQTRTVTSGGYTLSNVITGNLAAAVITADTSPVMGALVDGAVLATEAGTDGAYSSDYPGETFVHGVDGATIVASYEIEGPPSTWTATTANAVEADELRKVVTVTGSEGTTNTFTSAAITVTAAVVPPEINSIIAGTQSGGDITHTIDVSEACFVDRVLTTTATQPTPAQVGAGLNDTGASALDFDTANVTADGDYPFTLPSTLDGSGYYGHFSSHDGAGIRSATVTTIGPLTFDTIAPDLTLPTSANIAETTADGGITSDEAQGTLYAGLYLNSAGVPSATDLRAGTGAVYAASVTPVAGVNAFNATGLTGSTLYRWHFIQDDEQGNTPGVVSGTSFTTAAGGPTYDMLEQFTYTDTAQANDIAGITVTATIGAQTDISIASDALVMNSGYADIEVRIDGTYSQNGRLELVLTGSRAVGSDTVIELCIRFSDFSNYYSIALDFNGTGLVRFKKGRINGNAWDTEISFAAAEAIVDGVNGGALDLTTASDINPIILGIDASSLHSIAAFINGVQVSNTVDDSASPITVTGNPVIRLNGGIDFIATEIRQVNE